MKNSATRTFILDCPWCKAKVAATETGRAERDGFNDEAGEPFAYKVLVGICPSCDMGVKSTLDTCFVVNAVKKILCPDR